MLKVINTKLLIAILATLAVIGAALIHIRNASVRSAQILQQQKDASDVAKKQDAAMWDAIHKQQKKNNVNPVNGSKAWTHYLP